jgi:4-hydroxy-tetrahydrodipicolinate synthase
MTTPLADRLAGIHAATVLPLAPDFRVDEAALRAHLRAVSHAPGVRGLLVNGHAGENQFIDLAEKRLVMRAARAAAPGSSFLVCGVNCESSLAAAVEAEAMEADGADALLVFPPNGWALTQTPDSVLLHHRTIAAATSLIRRRRWPCSPASGVSSGLRRAAGRSPATRRTGVCYWPSGLISSFSARATNIF